MKRPNAATIVAGRVLTSFQLGSRYCRLTMSTFPKDGFSAGVTINASGGPKAVLDFGRRRVHLWVDHD